MHIAACLGAVPAYALGGNLGLGNQRQLVQFTDETRNEPLGQRGLDCALTQGAHIGKSHAVGRKHPGKRMHQNGVHAQHISDQASMLAAGPAKTLKRIVGHVVAALDRDLLDGIGHVLDSNSQEPVRKFFGCAGNAGGALDFCRHFNKARTHRIGVERFVLVWAEHGREEFRPQLAKHDITIRHRKRPATAI